jgi:hypothetical protein
MRLTMLRTWSALLPVLLLSLACSSSDEKDSGGNNGGADAADSGGPDTGEPPDAGPPDTGPPPDGGCTVDQTTPAGDGGVAQGCPSGQVCNVLQGTCSDGRSCTNDTECNVCSDIQRPESCGHGLSVVAVCDTTHGNVCTRSRSPCEPCNDDQDCGRMHPILGATEPIKCLTYPDGKFCGRPCRGGATECPNGFICDTVDQQCRTEVCPSPITVCPLGTPGDMCPGTDQICSGEVCPDTGGARCATNDKPGALGLCLNYCDDNTDCPADKPICNTGTGICINGCAMGGCAGGLTCHADGFCHPPCDANEDCETLLGAGFYCNLPGQPPPRYFKAYRDANSCAPLGCEDVRDCAQAGRVCDLTQAPPACVVGCYEDDDCAAGDWCRSTGGQPPQPSYTREQCRVLPEKTDPMEIGVCCNPGCRDRGNQCGLTEFCCAEPDSPYEDPLMCPTLTSTGGAMAQAGECFEAPVDPWCRRCTGASDCNSGWFGLPHQETCRLLEVGMGDDPPILAFCTTACNPDRSMDNGCPRGFECDPILYGCQSNEDCGGLECVGAIPMMQDGYCKCGEAGTQSVACPTTNEFTFFDIIRDPMSGMLDVQPVTIQQPQCITPPNNPLIMGMDMACVASYGCGPPFMANRFPAACDLQAAPVP